MQKCAEIQAGIVFANTAHNNRLCNNFSSCEKGVDHHLTTIADNINPVVCQDLDDNQHYNSCGVIMVNFAGGVGSDCMPWFVLAIANHNEFGSNLTGPAK